MKRIFFLILLMAASELIFAGSPGGIPFEIVNKGPGIRVLSMGGAGTANSYDATAVFWNQACLDGINKNELYVSVETFFDAANYDYFSYAGPVGAHGGVGISAGIMNYGSYERVNSEGVSLGEDGFMRDSFITVGYGKSLFEGIKAGAGLKLLLRSIEDDMHTAFNADISFFKSFGSNVDTGIVFRNIIPVSVKYSVDEEKFIHSARLGLAVRMFDSSLKAACDIEKYFIESDPVLYGGLEYNAAGLVDIRAGANTDAEFSGGIGISYSDIMLDYGLVYTEQVISHKIALSYRFGGYELKLTAEPDVFSPIGGNKKAYIRVDAATKHEIYKWKIEIFDSSGSVVEEWDGPGTPDKTVVWDGLKTDGLPLDEGTYRAVLTVVDENDLSIESEPLKIRISGSDAYQIPLYND